MTDQELIIKVKADTDKATKELGRLTKEVDKLSKGMKKGDKSLKASEKSFKGVEKATAGLNKQLVGLAATYLSFQGARELITTTAEVESGFIGVAKTTGLAGEAFKELENDLLEMSTVMAGVELSGLQSVAETAGQLGISGKENILEFTRVISMMGTATDLSAEEAATAMAKLGNSMSIPVTEFERLGSVINELSNNTTATAKDLVDMGQRISGVGKTFGLSADQILAFSATLKDVGMSAELGGTALSKVMLEMMKDTKSFAKVAGVSFADFADMIKNEPVKALELFIKSLGKLDKTAKIEALDDLGLKSSGVTQTILKLSDSTDVLAKNLKIAGDEWETNTSLVKEYEVAASGLDAQWTRVKNSFTVLAYKVGKELLPMMKELIDDTVRWVNTLDDDAVRRFGEGIGKVAEAVLGIGRALAWLNDIVVPDVLGGEDAGLLDTAAEGWANIGNHLGTVQSTYKALTDMDDWLDNIDSIDEAINKYDGLSSTYDDLSLKLQGLLSENLRLQQQFRNDGSVYAKNRLSELVVEQQRVLDLSTKLAQQQPFDNLSTDKATDEIKDIAKEADKTKKDIENNPIEVKIDTDPAFVKELKQRVRDLGKEKIPVDADTGKAVEQLEKIKTSAKEPTVSVHTVDPDTRAATRAIDILKQPTSSIHTVYIKEVRTAATGGLMPQKLAVGGAFKGSGKVPGYDATDSDRVNAKLTGGEYVIRRSAVDKIGVPILNAINSFKVPKIPGFAEGGLVGGGSSSQMQPINLHIGGNTFGVMADTEIASAIQRFINSEGGL